MPATLHAPPATCLSAYLRYPDDAPWSAHELARAAGCPADQSFHELLGGLAAGGILRAHDGVLELTQSGEWRLMQSGEMEEGSRAPDAVHSAVPYPLSPVPCLITLDQAAALVHRSKRTLERYRRKRGQGTGDRGQQSGTRQMPAPETKGGGGRPALWDYTQLRPWLELTFGLRLPHRFPTGY